MAQVALKNSVARDAQLLDLRQHLAQILEVAHGVLPWPRGVVLAPTAPATVDAIQDATLDAALSALRVEHSRYGREVTDAEQE